MVCPLALGRDLQILPSSRARTTILLVGSFDRGVVVRASSSRQNPVAPLPTLAD